eukprot:c7374_g1_i1 orf=250-615(-)
MGLPPYASHTSTAVPRWASKHKSIVILLGRWFSHSWCQKSVKNYLVKNSCCQSSETVGHFPAAHCVSSCPVAPYNQRAEHQADCRCERTLPKPLYQGPILIKQEAGSPMPRLSKSNPHLLL